MAGKIFQGTFVLLAVLTGVSVQAGQPDVTFEPAEDTARDAKGAADDSGGEPPAAAPEVKARSKAFTVYKPPAPVAPPEPPEAGAAEAAKADSAATDPEPPALPEPPVSSSDAGSAEPKQFGTLTGPVVSTVLKGEHSPQAVREALPQLPKVKINGLGNGTLKLGH